MNKIARRIPADERSWHIEWNATLISIEPPIVVDNESRSYRIDQLTYSDRCIDTRVRLVASDLILLLTKSKYILVFTGLTLFAPPTTRDNNAPTAVAIRVLSLRPIGSIASPQLTPIATPTKPTQLRAVHALQTGHRSARGWERGREEGREVLSLSYLSTRLTDYLMIVVLPVLVCVLCVVWQWRHATWFHWAVYNRTEDGKRSSTHVTHVTPAMHVIRPSFDPPTGHQIQFGSPSQILIR